MELDHLAYIHAIDVVGGEYRDNVRVVCLEEINVLVDGVGSPFELAAQRIRARQKHLDAAFAIGKPRRPRRGDMLDERFGLVLREHVDRGNARIDEVAQDEIDEPVAAGKRHRWLGVLRGQRMEPRPFTACQHHRDDVHASWPFLVAVVVATDSRIIGRRSESHYRLDAYRVVARTIPGVVELRQEIQLAAIARAYRATYHASPVLAECAHGRAAFPAPS